MQIVQDRLNLNKPPPQTGMDPKTGKLAAGAINNNKDLDVEFKKEEPSFFGSFFAGGKAAAKKKGAPVMDSVSISALLKRALKLNIDGLIFVLTSFDSDCVCDGTAASCHSPPSCAERA